MHKLQTNADECVQSFHNWNADHADMKRTVTDSADAIRTHYG